MIYAHWYRMLGSVEEAEDALVLPAAGTAAAGTMVTRPMSFRPRRSLNE